MTNDDHKNANRRSWNERVAIHMDDRTGIYDVEGFLSGDSGLLPIEESQIGDVSGLHIAHLQCHFGLDSLCLARRGATVTGIDFSESAIAAARALSARADLPAEFVHADVYEAADILPSESFDLVYVSWGALNWLSDIDAWAKVVAALLKSGGQLFLADAHPSMQQMEEAEDGRLVVTYPLNEPLLFREETTYAGDGRPLVNRDTYEWIHSTAGILCALIEAGLRVDSYREYDTLPWPAVPRMVKTQDRMFKMPENEAAPPLAFSLFARKP